MNNPQKIAAVIVTHNRKRLLGECLDALMRQTRPLNSIIIIDNASNDGTQDFLQQNYLQNPIFDYIRLPDNLGGAGGFSSGIERGLQKAFDWLWLMDDDAEPSGNALEVLVNSSFFDAPATGALLCGITNHDNSASQSGGVITSTEAVARCEKIFTGKTLTSVDFERPFLKVATYPLLGILAKCDAVRKVGNVRSDFFIFCDDTDFTLRISDAYDMVLIKDSRLLHKANLAAFMPRSFFGKTFYFIPINGFWREYYSCRNYIYLIRQRLGLAKALFNSLYFLKPVTKALLFGDYKFQRTAIYFKAIKDALSGNLGKNIDPQKVRMTKCPTVSAALSTQ
jgi:GT2 family glycosyltransferase